MSKTMEDLKTAFAGESQANRKYTAFAKKADEEGYHQVARLFRAAAYGETIHALRHFRNMGEIKSTKENLEAAIAGETYEFTEMYPPFVENAKAESNKPAEKGFADANAVEQVHAKLYKEALENLGKPGEEFDYYVCPICGYVHAKGAPERCPVCNTPGSKFEKMS